MGMRYSRADLFAINEQELPKEPRSGHFYVVNGILHKIVRVGKIGPEGQELKVLSAGHEKAKGFSFTPSSPKVLMVMDKKPIWCNEDAVRKYRSGESITGFKKMFGSPGGDSKEVEVLAGSVLNMVDLPSN